MKLEYIPYTYLIGWSKLDKWYYGCQYGSSTRTANPSNLWNNYFTSSKYVRDFRKIHGKPDVIQIRKTFISKEDCLLWEHKVLRRMKVSNNDKFLNINDTNSKFCSNEKSAKIISERLKEFFKNNPAPNAGKIRGPQSKELIERRTKASGEARRGKKLSIEHRNALSEAHKGKTPSNKGVPCSEKQKRDISETLRNKPKITCPACKRTMTEAHYKTYFHGEKCTKSPKVRLKPVYKYEIIYIPTQETFLTYNLKEFCLAHGIYPANLNKKKQFSISKGYQIISKELSA